MPGNFVCGTNFPSVFGPPDHIPHYKGKIIRSGSEENGQGKFLLVAMSLRILVPELPYVQ